MEYIIFEQFSIVLIIEFILSLLILKFVKDWFMIDWEAIGILLILALINLSALFYVDYLNEWQLIKELRKKLRNWLYMNINMNKNKIFYNIKRVITYIFNIIALIVFSEFILIDLIFSLDYKRIKKEVKELVIYGQYCEKSIYG